MRNEPTAVILWMRDGTEREEYFPTRWQAEMFLALVPFAVTPEGAHEVEAAMLSPLVEI